VGHLLKQLVGLLFRPLTVALLLLVCGLLLSRRNRPRAARRLLGSSLAVLLLFAYPLATPLLVRSLAGRYPPLTRAELASVPEGTNGLAWVVVLCAGGFSSDADRPVNSRIGVTFLQRLMEGVRVCRLAPNASLLISLAESESDSREFLDEFATLVGLPKDRLVPLLDARDTAAELRLVKAMVGAQPFVLVTSELHMPRAMLLCRRFGLNALPSPAGCKNSQSTPRRLQTSDLLPSTGRMAIADEAIHELLGLGWMSLQRSAEP
jgi:uncharacterized SAM-binding protein YcdF (DUF218 family)